MNSSNEYNKQKKIDKEEKKNRKVYAGPTHPGDIKNKNFKERYLRFLKKWVLAMP